MTLAIGIRRPVGRLALAATLLAAPALALAGPGRAGLWELQTRLNGTLGGLRITPDQIAELEQLGLSVPGLGRPYVARQCISPAQAAADGLPQPQTGSSGCRLDQVHHHGRVWTAGLRCDGDLQGRGTMRALFPDREHFDGYWTFNGRSALIPGDIELRNPFSGQWLGPDCSAVPP